MKPTPISIRQKTQANDAMLAYIDVKYTRMGYNLLTACILCLNFLVYVMI